MSCTSSFFSFFFFSVFFFFFLAAAAFGIKLQDVRNNIVTGIVSFLSEDNVL